MTRDPVRSEVRKAVFRRDAAVTGWGRAGTRTGAPICVAPYVDPDAGPCSGRTTLDHVKSELRLAKRAPSDTAHLVSLCVGHTEGGAKAGRQWNTAHRAELRAYLRGTGGRP